MIKLNNKTRLRWKRLHASLQLSWPISPSYKTGALLDSLWNTCWRRAGACRLPRWGACFKPVARELPDPQADPLNQKFERALDVSIKEFNEYHDIISKIVSFLALFGLALMLDDKIIL